MWWRQRRGAEKLLAVLTHVLGVAYVASAPVGFVDAVWVLLVFCGYVLDSVGLGFAGAFWIPAGKDVYVAEVGHYGRCRGIGAYADIAI
jgi:hypothetical protein